MYVNIPVPLVVSGSLGVAPTNIPLMSVTNAKQRITTCSHKTGCDPWRKPGCPCHIHSLDGTSHTTQLHVTPGSFEFNRDFERAYSGRPMCGVWGVKGGLAKAKQRHITSLWLLSPHFKLLDLLNTWPACDVQCATPKTKDIKNATPRALLL